MSPPTATPAPACKSTRVGESHKRAERARPPREPAAGCRPDAQSREPSGSSNLSRRARGLSRSIARDRAQPDLLEIHKRATIKATAIEQVARRPIEALGERAAGRAPPRRLAASPTTPTTAATKTNRAARRDH